MAVPADRSFMDPTHDRDTRAAADRSPYPVHVPARRSRRPHIGAVALAILLVAAAVSAGVSYRNGRAWERRAGQQAARADGAERRAAELRGQLDKSESTVDRLQRRMRDLADEKAQAEDQREILRVYTKQYRELTEVSGSVSAELSSCIGQLADAMALIGDPYATGILSQAVSDCRTALDDSQTLQALIESMPEPPGS
jgi:flagellar motility protein MotE (MotC chaperone)